MYKILGPDGKEYGPVSAEIIIQWINEGRATASTSARPDAAVEWKPLSAFPEFAAALGAKAASGPPPLVAGDSTILANEILTRGYNLAPGHCIGRSWELLKRHFWLLLGATFIVHVIKGVPLVGWLLSGVLKGGLFFLYLRLIRGQKAEFSDAFRGFNQSFLQLFLAGVVTSLLTSVGWMLCIVPGIYLTVAWILAEPLVIDKNLEFWPAMELSRKVITAHWWQFFGLGLLCLLVLLLGFVACCVGVFVATPVVIGALAYAYEDVFGSPAAPPAQSV
jgi:hypothetical protein